LSLSIRARLTLWYTAVLSVVLVVSAAASFVVYARSRQAAVDEELSRADALVARLVTQELAEGSPLPEAAHDALEDLIGTDRLLAVFDEQGVHLFGPWDGLPAVPAQKLADTGHATDTVEAAIGPFRVRRARYRLEQTIFHVGVAQSLVDLRRELAGLRRALFGGVLFALLLAAGGGFWIAYGALRPVARMADQARGISGLTPGFRLSSGTAADELGVLAAAFNDLLGRLEKALAQQRQFMADASHELRTPVSVARTAIEVSLARSGRTETEYRDSLGVVGEQMRRLTRLVEDMFTLARADVAPLPLEPGRLYLDEVVEACVEEARLLGAAKRVELICTGPQDLEAYGDERRLRQMLMNLLDNAVRHTPSGGSVKVELASLPETLEIAVTDGGSGIPEAERQRIFERFVRLDASRRASDGAGLGLPIARMIAEAHAGSLALSRSDSSGSTFLVRLPAATASV
jgi:signal transduction histidine kinase